MPTWPDCSSGGISDLGSAGIRWSGVSVALEGKRPQRQSQKRLDGRLEEVAEAVGGGYCRSPMPLKLVLAVRETVAGHTDAL